MKKSIYVFYSIFLLSCRAGQVLDIDKLDEKYFIGRYYNENFQGININVTLKDSTYICTYALDGKNIIDSGKWYFTTFRTGKEFKYTVKTIELLNFPFGFGFNNENLSFIKSHLSFEIDCNSELGDLYMPYAINESEFRLIKKDKSQNHFYLKHPE
jgi:hypothetical protein